MKMRKAREPPDTYALVAVYPARASAARHYTFS